MVTLLLHLLRLLPMLCGGHRQVALENLALRHQLAVYKKMVNRPKLLSSDRLFWVALSRVWAGWRQALVIVSPNTVLRWQRRRFREYWARLSARPPSRAAHPSMLRSRLSSGGWLRPIRCGAPPEFTGNFSGWGSTSPSAPSLGLCRSGAPCRLRLGGRSSPTMSAISSPSISSRCQPCACASSLFSSCSLTTAGASSTST